MKMLTAEMEKLIEKTYTGEPITLEERFNFITYVPFQDFLKYMGSKLEIKEYESPKSVARIISTFHKKSPTAFERLGVETIGSVTFNLKGEKKHEEIEEVNVQSKVKFNKYLDALIRDSFKFEQITTDYDITGKAAQIKSDENRAAYKAQGPKRLDALKEMTENGGEATVLLKFKEGDQPQAVNSARYLFDAGAAVYNNTDAGECFGAGRRVVLKTGWQEYVMKVMESDKIKSLNEETGITQASLKRIKNGGKPTPKEALILEQKFKEMFPEDTQDPIDVQPYAFFINRDYYDGNLGMPMVCEEPQLHKAFCVIVLEKWNGAAKWVLDYIDNKKKTLAQVEEKDLPRRVA